MTYDPTIPLPESKATNVYDLLQDLYRVIEQEPTRLDMAASILAIRGKRYYSTDTTGLPPCGTVGCYAGWINILTRNPSEHNIGGITPKIEGNGGTLQIVAPKGSGLDYKFYNLFFENFPTADYGTPEYGEQALARLKKFITDNEEQLWQTPVNRFSLNEATSPA